MANMPPPVDPYCQFLIEELRRVLKTNNLELLRHFLLEVRLHFQRHYDEGQLTFWYSILSRTARERWGDNLGTLELEQAFFLEKYPGLKS